MRSVLVGFTGLVWRLLGKERYLWIGPGIMFFLMTMYTIIHLQSRVVDSLCIDTRLHVL